MNRNLPTPDEVNYGNERHAEGYAKGWNQNTYDRRRRKSLKEDSLFRQFGNFLDYLDDMIAANKKH